MRKRRRRLHGLRRNPVADDRGFSGKRARLAAGSVARGRHARDPCGSPAPVLPGRRYRRAREQARLAQKRRSSPPEEPLMRERLHFLLLNVGHLPRPSVHADLRHGGGARAASRVGPGLCRALEVRHARLLRLRRIRASRRLDRRQVEPRRHDERVLHRHRVRLDRHLVRAHAARDRHWPVRRRRIRRHLPPGRPRHRGGEVEEHGHAHRRQRRLGKPRRRQRRAAHRLLHRSRRLAHGIRGAGRRLDPDRHRLHRPDVGGDHRIPSIVPRRRPRQPVLPADIKACWCGCRPSCS